MIKLGDYLSVQAHKPCSCTDRRTNHALVSHLYHNIQCRFAQYGVSLAKDWVSEECGTNSIIYLKNVCFNKIHLFCHR